jgi:hypothetical protein
MSIISTFSSDRPFRPRIRPRARAEDMSEQYEYDPMFREDTPEFVCNEEEEGLMIAILFIAGSAGS